MFTWTLTFHCVVFGLGQGPAPKEIACPTWRVSPIIMIWGMVMSPFLCVGVGGKKRSLFCGFAIGRRWCVLDRSVWAGFFLGVDVLMTFLS